MGRFPISDSIVGKAMRATGKTGTPDGYQLGFLKTKQVH